MLFDTGCFFLQGLIFYYSVVDVWVVGGVFAVVGGLGSGVELGVCYCASPFVNAELRSSQAIMLNRPALLYKPLVRASSMSKSLFSRVSEREEAT